MKKSLICRKFLPYFLFTSFFLVSFVHTLIVFLPIMISKFNRVFFLSVILFFSVSLMSAQTLLLTAEDPAEYPSTLINGKRIGVKSKWIHSPSTSNRLNIDNFNNTVFTSLAATASEVYVSYCSPANNINYVMRFDAETGESLGSVFLQGLPEVTVPISDIFIDSSGNLCGCSKAFDGEAENDGKLFVYKIGADGVVGVIHVLSVSPKNEAVSSCRIVGDVDSGNFSTWAAGVVGSDIRILYWHTPTEKVKVSATNILSDSDYNVVEVKGENKLYLSTMGNRLMELTIDEEVKASEVEGSVRQNCGMAYFDVSSVKMLTYTSSCTRTADVKFSIIVDGNDGVPVWTIPEAGLGFQSLCSSSTANVRTKKISEHTTRLYVYSAAIGLAAYEVYNVKEGAVDTVGESSGWHLEGDKVCFDVPCCVTLYDLSGRVVKTIGQTDAVDVGELSAGVYIISTDTGLTIKIPRTK